MNSAEMSLPYVDCRKCVAKGCDSTSATQRVFRFPKLRTPSERLRHSKWAEFAQNPKVTGVHNTHAYLCEQHFARNQFRDDDRDRLIYRALPTIPAASNVMESFVHPAEDNVQYHPDTCVNSPLQGSDAEDVFVQSPGYISVHSSEEDCNLQTSGDDCMQPQVQTLYPSDSTLGQFVDDDSVASWTGEIGEPFPGTETVTSASGIQNISHHQAGNNEDVATCISSSTAEKLTHLGTVGISDEHCVNGSYFQTKCSKMIGECCSVSSENGNCGGKREVLNFLGCKSRKKITPRIKRKSKDPSARKEHLLPIMKSKYKQCKEYLKCMQCMNGDRDLVKGVPAERVQLCREKRRLRGRSWTAAEKLLALTVRRMWPQCHTLLASTSVLPGKRILHDMLSQVTLVPGLNEHVFQSLAEAVSDLDVADRTCILLFDKMPVCQHLDYDEKTDVILGFQNLRELNEPVNIGSQVLTFMAKGLNTKWEQLVAFYVTSGSVSPLSLAKAMRSIFRSCRKAGLCVVGTVCTTDPDNMATLKALGASENKPYFVVDHQQVVTLYDVPHLLVCLTDVLLEQDLSTRQDVSGEVEGRTASWSVIRRAYEVDGQRPACRRLHKLTDGHVAPEGCSSTRVAVAAQVLSHTMATTISSLVGSGRLDQSALATAHMVDFCDKLFDSLNGRTVEQRGAHGLRCQLRKEREGLHLDFWDESIVELKRWRVAAGCVARGRASQHSWRLCQSGWIATLEGMKLLWVSLKQLGFKSLQPRSIGLVTLQCFLGSVRSEGVANVNPTVLRFVSSAKKSLMNGLAFVDVTHTDGDADDGWSSARAAVACCSGSSRDCDRFVAARVDRSDRRNSSSSCVACGILRKVLFGSDCDVCERALCAVGRDPNLRCGIIFKERSDTEDGLTYPSAELVRCVTSAADVAERVLPTVAHLEGVHATILSIVLETVNCDWLHLACSVHAENVRKDILAFVSRVAILQWCRRRNLELSGAA